MASKLLVIDKRIDNIPPGVKYILNFSIDNIDDKRILDYSKEFRELFDKVKMIYIEFIYQFGKNSGLLDRQIQGAPLWWFSEIQHKDSWADDFLRDLTAVNLIRSIRDELKIDSVEYHGNSPLICSYAGLRPPSNNLLVINYFIGRFKLLLRYLLVRFIYKKQPINSKIKNVFLSYFPILWYKFDGKLLDRNFKDEPYRISNSFVAIYVDKLQKSIFKKETPDKSIIIQSFLSVRFILKEFFNFTNYLWYIVNRGKIRKLCVCNGIDIWPVFDKYICQTVLINDYLYSVLIAGLRNIINEFGPKNLISTGEFGLEAKAATVACAGTQTRSIWYQHSPFTTTKFYLFNHSEEVAGSIKDNTYKLCQEGYNKFMPLPDKMLVWSQYSIDFLERYSHYPVNRCKVVGSIKFSDFKQVAASNKKKSANNYEKKVFFVPTVLEIEVRQFCYFISELCKDKFLRKEDVVLKLHPAAEKFFNISKLVSEYENIKDIQIILGSAGVEKYLESVKCFVAGGTTIGIEASFFGIPLIQYMPYYRLNLSVLDANMATCFSDINSLKEALGNLDKIKPIDYRLFFAEPDRTNKRFSDALEE